MGADPGCCWVVQGGSPAGTDNQAEPERRSSPSECRAAGKSAAGCTELPGEWNSIREEKWDRNTDKALTPEMKTGVVENIFSDTHSSLFRLHTKLEQQQ